MARRNPAIRKVRSMRPHKPNRFCRYLVIQFISYLWNLTIALCSFTIFSSGICDLKL